MSTQGQTESQSEGHNKVDANRTMGHQGVAVDSLLTPRNTFPFACTNTYIYIQPSRGTDFIKLNFMNYSKL